jgi:hypothetical protein
MELPGMRPCSVDALIKGYVGAFKGIDDKRAEYVRGIGQNLALQYGEEANCEHGLRAIDERNGFLGFEDKRLDAGVLQGIGRRPPHALEHCFAFANQYKPEMRQWR